jgi:hypothetical protein
MLSVIVCNEYLMLCSTEDAFNPAQNAQGHNIMVFDGILS